MLTPILEKTKTEYGHLRLEIHFGSVNDTLYFENESEFQGFAYMLRMMASTNAGVIGVECNEPKVSEETEEGAAE